MIYIPSLVPFHCVIKVTKKLSGCTFINRRINACLPFREGMNSNELLQYTRNIITQGVSWMWNKSKKEELRRFAIGRKTRGGIISDQIVKGKVFVEKWQLNSESSHVVRGKYYTNKAPLSRKFVLILYPWNVHNCVFSPCNYNLREKWGYCWPRSAQDRAFCLPLLLLRRPARFYCSLRKGSRRTYGSTMLFEYGLFNVLHKY